MSTDDRVHLSENRDYNWEEFRQIGAEQENTFVLRKRKRTFYKALCVAIGIAALLFLIGVFLRNPPSATFARIKNEVTEFIEARKPEVTKEQHAPTIRGEVPQHRSMRFLNSSRIPENSPLGELRIYVLKGDHFVLVTPSKRFALLDTKTGDIRWIEDDGNSGREVAGER